MNATRKIAITASAVFIVATVASLLAAAVTPALSGPDYLDELAAHANQATAGVLLYVISAFASAGVAIALYPVLKERSSGLALGAVIFRSLEAALYLVGIVSLLSLVTLARQFAAAGAGDRAVLQTLGDALVSVRSHASLFAVFAFTLGASMYYYVFFQARLIPRWLSGWGLVAVVVMLAACLLALFNDSPVTGYVALAFPLFLQELVLAVWLIAKGFRAPAGAAASWEPEAKPVLSAS